MKKIHVRKITVALLSAISIIMLVACLNEFDNVFYCDLCGSMHNDGKANYICVGSVDVTLCDEHNAEFLKGTEKISVDSVLSLIESDSFIKVKSIGGVHRIIKYDGKFQIDDRAFDTKDDFIKHLEKHLISDGYVYIMTE